MIATEPNPPVLELMEPGALAELGQKKSILVQMREEFSGLSCDTKEGYAETHAAIQRLVKIRTWTDKTRLALGETAREWIAKVNAQAKEIIDAAKEIETPLRADLAEKQRLQAIEDARLAELRAKEAKEKAEREAKEAAAQAELDRIAAEEVYRAEMERLEAVKPDREKLAKWLGKIAKAVESAPDLATEEGCKVRDVAIGKFADAAEFLRGFCVTQ